MKLTESRSNTLITVKTLELTEGEVHRAIKQWAMIKYGFTERCKVVLDCSVTGAIEEVTEESKYD